MLNYLDILVIFGKYRKVSHFIKSRANGGATTKFMILWSLTTDYQLPQRLKVLKVLDCFPYVIEARGAYEICYPYHCYN